MAALLLSITLDGTEDDLPAIVVELVSEKEEPPSPPEEPPQPKPQPKPVRQQPVAMAPQTPSAPARPELPPALAFVETTGPTAPIVAMIAVPDVPSPSKEAARQSYALALWQHIHLFKPFKLRAEGTALASFTLSARGMLVSSEISSSSGQARLDEAALESLRRAQPFPPRPPELGTQPLSFTIPFQFKARSP